MDYKEKKINGVMYRCSPLMSEQAFEQMDFLRKLLAGALDGTDGKGKAIVGSDISEIENGNLDGKVDIILSAIGSLLKTLDMKEFYKFCKEMIFNTEKKLEKGYVAVEIDDFRAKYDELLEVVMFAVEVNGFANFISTPISKLFGMDLKQAIQKAKTN